ncbi:MAG: hypothetical protein ACJ70P_02130 [Nitrososphaera sp.]
MSCSSEQFNVPRGDVTNWRNQWNLGLSFRNGCCWRSYYSNNYNDNISFFTGLARRPKIEVFLARSNSRVGFEVKVQRNGIRRPSADCNGTQYDFEKQNHDAEKDFLQTKTAYFVYPFGIDQDPSKGAYIIQRDSMFRELNKFDTTIQASIHIRGKGFEMEKDYVLKTNLSGLRTKRLNQNELIRPENVTFSFEEIKEPSIWRRFLSSFGVTRTRIPK